MSKYTYITLIMQIIVKTSFKLNKIIFKFKVFEIISHILKALYSAQLINYEIYKQKKKKQLIYIQIENNYKCLK